MLGGYLSKINQRSRMTPEYRKKTEKKIKEYLKGQGFEEIKNMQVEETFDDLESEVHVWNVKTDQGAWWVVQGDYVPMNLGSDIKMRSAMMLICV